MILIMNASNDQIEGMYGGVPFIFPPKAILPVPDDAGVHLLVTRPQLKRVDESKVTFRLIDDDQDGKPELAPEPEAAPIVETLDENPLFECDVCGKSFADKAKPGFSLAQHKRLAHKPEVEAAPEA